MIERTLVVVGGAFVLAAWAWMSFVSSQSAPLGVKLIGTTSAAIVFGIVLAFAGAALLDWRGLRTPLPGRPRRESIPKRLRDEIWIKCEGRCQWRENGMLCGRREHLEIDHIVPVSRGGKNTYRNLQLLCQEHNRRKAAQLHEPPEDLQADVPAEPPAGWEG